ncbi:MAG: C-GCAxxG-C-C family protein [Thermoguttaceae bacterium]|nr:C-GCAxxG-C-C family protein [Thermoguttaceae bacterium]MDW8079593.1 C-GCAxxG-C-C family protein [Thermoguttaceae bacterium]
MTTGQSSLASEAVAKFTSGYACSQAILAVFGPRFGLDEATAAKLGAGFGGGLGRLGYACGAVSGAVAILGLSLGNGVGADVANREKVYEAVQEFCRRFIERHGSIDCRQLIGRDIASPEAFAAAKQANVFRTICPEFVRTAAEILEKMLGPPSGGG